MKKEKKTGAKYFYKSQEENPTVARSLMSRRGLLINSMEEVGDTELSERNCSDAEK